MTVEILGLAGSPRKGATEYVVEEALRAAQELPGVSTKFMTLRGKKIQPCTGCDYCKTHKTRCCIKDDMEDLFEEFVKADAYLIASPVYVMAPTPQLAAFFSRLRPLHHVYPGLLRNKPGGAIAVGGTRHGGQEVTVNILINYMLTRGLIVVGGEIGGYAGGKVWSQDKKEEGAAADSIGLETVRGLARRVAEVALLLKAAQRK